MKAVFKKSVAMALSSVLWLGVVGTHAQAMPAGPEAGVGVGQVQFGKILDCEHHGGATAPSGAGVGFWPTPAKRAWARIRMAVTAAVGGEGALTLCVRLNPIASNVSGGIGASCDLSKGYAGKGKITLAEGSTVWLDDIGWKASILTLTGTYYVLSGKAFFDHDGAYPKAKNKPYSGIASSGMFLGLMEAQDAGCYYAPPKGSKWNDSEGHRLTTLAVMTFAVQPFGVPTDLNTVPLLHPDGRPVSMPLTCKQTGSPLCLYGDKD